MSLGSKPIIRETFVFTAKEWQRRTQVETGVPLERVIASVLRCAQQDDTTLARRPTAVTITLSDRTKHLIDESGADPFLQRTIEATMVSLRKLVPSSSWTAVVQALSDALNPNHFSVSADGDSAEIVSLLAFMRRPSGEPLSLVSCEFVYPPESALIETPAPAAAKRVGHTKFGPGTVLRELGGKVEVQFDDGCTRTLLARVLQPLSA